MQKTSRIERINKILHIWNAINKEKRTNALELESYEKTNIETK